MKSIDYDQSGFSVRCKTWIDEGEPFVVEVGGWKGKALAKVLGLKPNGMVMAIEPATASLIVALATLSALVAIVLYALSKDYDVEAEVDPKTGKVKVKCTRKEAA